MPIEFNNDDCEDMTTFIAYCLQIRHYIAIEWPFVSSMMNQPPVELQNPVTASSLNEEFTQMTWQGFIGGIPAQSVAGDVASCYSNHLRSLGFSYLD